MFTIILIFAIADGEDVYVILILNNIMQFSINVIQLSIDRKYVDLIYQYNSNSKYT